MIAHAFYQLEKINIAHRDIKPENIMINEKFDKVLLIDIGTAEYSSVNDQK